jgi:hypothetical protein
MSLLLCFVCVLCVCVCDERSAMAGTAGARDWHECDTLALQKGIVLMLTRAEEVEAMLAALR